MMILAYFIIYGKNIIEIAERKVMFMVDQINYV